MESINSPGRAKAPLWIRLRVNLHEYMCVYECEITSERKIIFINLYEHTCIVLSHVVCPLGSLAFFSWGAQWVQRIICWNETDGNSLLHWIWMYKINVKKRICELVATALHRLFHYFFSRHPDITEPRPKRFDAAPWKFDHRFVLSTVTLIPRWNIFVLSNDVMKWFYHRKKIQKPTFRAVLTTVNSFSQRRW